MLVLFLLDHSCLMYQVLRWCLTVRAQLNSTVSFPVPVHLFPLSECLCSAGEIRPSVDWSGEVSELHPVILQWNGLIDCCAPLFTFPASEQVLFGPRPLFHSVFPSPFQLPSSHQVGVHPGVTSCLVARDNQTAVYVTIISKAGPCASLSLFLSLLLWSLFPCSLSYFSLPGRRSVRAIRPVRPLLQIHTLLIQCVQWFTCSSHCSAHHAYTLSTNHQPWLIKPAEFSANQREALKDCLLITKQGCTLLPCTQDSFSCFLLLLHILLYIHHTVKII